MHRDMHTGESQSNTGKRQPVRAVVHAEHMPPIRCQPHSRVLPALRQDAHFALSILSVAYPTMAHTCPSHARKHSKDLQLFLNIPLLSGMSGTRPDDNRYISVLKHKCRRFEIRD